MTDTPLAPTTDKRPDDCNPLRLDFPSLVEEVEAGDIDRAIPHKAKQLVEHIALHLREEVPELGAREIASILLSVSVATDVVALRSRAWTARNVIDLIASVGAHLWREKPQPAPDATSEYWAAWQPDGKLYGIKAYLLAHTLDEVRAEIDREDVLVELEPITEQRAGELRARIGQVCR